MGNNKKKNNKQSSYIPTQEFVDKFTQELIYTARSVLAGLEYHPKDFTEKVLKPKVPGGDLVKPSSLSDKDPHGSLTSENSLPSLAKKLQPQQGNKGKQKDQSNQHVSIETYAHPVIDESMNIDESADLSIATSQLNQEGNLGSTQSTSSTTTPIGTSPPNDITQSEEKIKKSKITRLILNNNVVHTSQEGQVRTIMIYDIPTAWSHDAILNKLSNWGKVLEISFKPQHKYQSVWTKMILRSIIDTDFVMRTWGQKLDDEYVRWYPGHWKLKDRKERERFQAKITIPSDASKDTYNNYHKGRSFDIFIQKTLKAKSITGFIDKGLKHVILYFESQKDLHAAMEIQQDWKMTISQSPFTRQNKSSKDKKKNLKSFKGKKAEPKSSTSSNKNSHDKSKKYNKMDDDTWFLLKLILNLLS
ncbi:unnamed protein product [Rhizophagus irregularis]|nr:unnamed protein product [Rhizophagus irregularis]